LAFAYGDRTSTSIILDNLLQNAVNYSPLDSCITISAQEYEHTIVVSVTDQGPGIPNDQMAHIFERFHRVRGQEKQTSGFGLGLYIAKKLSQAQQGEIWVENATNRGACFSFALKKLEDK
jgi:signal transduction histidine kinase